MFYSSACWILFSVPFQTAGDVQGLVEIHFLQIVPLNPFPLEYCPLHSLHTLPTCFWFVLPDICKWKEWLLLIFPSCPWIYSRFLTSTLLCRALSNHWIQLLNISCLPSSLFNVLRQNFLMLSQLVEATGSLNPKLSCWQVKQMLCGLRYWLY